MLEFTVLLANVEGALVRVLGTIERRGFRLGAISTHTTPHGTRLSLNLSSDGRPADVLLRQIHRLHDVLDASFDVARPAFVLPASAIPPPVPMPKPSRRGISFLGIPERISAN
jgi:acetolactate synthase regulatory subunit